MRFMIMLPLKSSVGLNFITFKLQLTLEINEEKFYPSQFYTVFFNQLF